MKRLKILGLFLVLAICAAAVGVALASNGKRTARPHAKAVPVSQVSQAKSHSAKAVRAKTVRARSTAGDPDNVQQGDQSAPDTGAPSSESPSGESSSESAPSDGPGGFADKSASADTQQQGEH